MYEPGGAPKQWTVPAQRDAPPIHLPLLPPATAPRGGHHNWGAVVAALAVGIALLGLLGTGDSVIDLDPDPAPAREAAGSPARAPEVPRDAELP